MALARLSVMQCFPPINGEIECFMSYQ